MIAVFDNFIKDADLLKEIEQNYIKRLLKKLGGR